jgi:hypothetical protein
MFVFVYAVISSSSIGVNEYNPRAMAMSIPMLSINLYTCVRRKPKYYLFYDSFPFLLGKLIILFRITVAKIASMAIGELALI